MEVHEIELPRSFRVRWAMWRAWLWSRLRRSAWSVRLVKWVLERELQHPFVVVWAGQMLARHGSREDAVGVYCAAEGLSAGSFDAYRTLGQYLASVDESARAVEFLREACRLRPADSETGRAYLQELLIWLLQEEGRRKRRRLVWDSGAGAWAEERKGHWQEALALASRFVAEEATDADRHYDLGVCYWNLDRHDEALVEFREALRLDPGNEARAEIVRFHEGWLGRLARGAPE